MHGSGGSHTVQLYRYQYGILWAAEFVLWASSQPVDYRMGLRDLRRLDARVHRVRSS